MSAENDPLAPDWKWGTPEGSREFDRRLDRWLTFRERVMWLEEAETLSLALEASRKKQKATGNRQQAEE